MSGKITYKSIKQSINKLVAVVRRSFLQVLTIHTYSNSGTNYKQAKTPRKAIALSPLSSYAPDFKLSINKKRLGHKSGFSNSKYQNEIILAWLL